MEVAELRTRLKAGQTEGCFLFCGEEAFLRRHYLRQLRRAILSDPALAPFNHFVGEGEKIDFHALRNAMEAPPMLADRKLLEWHLADFSAMREEEMSLLRRLADDAGKTPGLTLVLLPGPDGLAIGTLPRRPSRLFSSLSAFLTTVVFSRQTDAALAQWILRHLSQEGISADRDTIDAMLALCGRDMDTLSGEIGKLVCSLHAQHRDRAGKEDILQICAPGGEEDGFALSNALLDGNPDAAYAALSDMKRRKVEPTLALGTVTRAFSELYLTDALASGGCGKKELANRLKIHEYKAGLYLRAVRRYDSEALRQALAACRRADRLAKNANMEPYRLLEVLLAELLAGKTAPPPALR